MVSFNVVFVVETIFGNLFKIPHIDTFYIKFEIKQRLFPYQIFRISFSNLMCQLFECRALPDSLNQILCFFKRFCISALR